VCVNRTYVEDEVTNDRKSRDLYEKMISIDSDEPTIEEHRSKAITKLRYMQVFSYYIIF